jgi:uncharacterized protein YdhG (YjbR/CyaY superfamily)
MAPTFVNNYIIAPMAKTDFKSITEYIASKPRPVQTVLKRVRSAIRKAIPTAKEGIAYQIPTYKLNDMQVIYFAGWKEHYSLYPASEALVAAFKDELSGCKISKGTIRFSLSEPVPSDLIGRIVRFRVDQLEKRDKGRGRGKGRESQLERVRRICATMPSVFEKPSHGAPTFFVEKDKGVFAMFMDNHHYDGEIAVWLAAPPGLQPALIEEAPDTYFNPPYVGTSGWIGLRLDHITDNVLEIHIRKSWELCMPKKKKLASRKASGR